MSKHEKDIEQVVTKSDFHLESYYESLKDWTFTTVFYDLSMDKAKALSNARARRVRGQPESPLITTIAEEINEQIESLGGRAVVRLSTRSPKDIVTQRVCTFTYFAEEEKKLLPLNLREDVRQMISLTRAAGKAMSVSSGREAVDMFIDSQRVFDDITTACSLNQVLRVIVRKYIPLYNELELRVFVNQHKVSAISQYYASCHVHWLHENKEKVQDDVINAVNEISKLLSIEDYVIDFAFDENYKLWVVEINLPPPLAGMSMFDKHNQNDLDIVKGKKEFEFRLAPLDSTKDCREKYRMFFDAYQKKTNTKIKTEIEKPKRKLRTSF